jgi:hypothetical protein
MASPHPSRHGTAARDDPSVEAVPSSRVNESLDSLRVIVERIVSNWDDLSSTWMVQKEEVEEALERIIGEVERIRANR